MRARRQSICILKGYSQQSRTLCNIPLLHIIEIALSSFICEQDIVLAGSMPLCLLEIGLLVSSATSDAGIPLSEYNGAQSR